MVAEPITCPHADRCGGCDLLGVSYPDQLAGKEARVAAALAPYRAVVAAPVSPARGADPIVGYRTRLKWMAGPRAALGLFARGGHEVVDTPGCRVADPGLAAIADAVRALLRSATHARVAASLRAVDLRAIEDAPPVAEDLPLHRRPRALVTLVLVREERPPRKDLESFAAALRDAQPGVLGVSANWVAKRSIQVLGPDTETIAGAATALDRQGEVAVTAAPGGFVQAHRGQAAAMAAELVARIVSPGMAGRVPASGGGASPAPRGAAGDRARSASPRVLELFAGAAPFGLALARAGCDVTAVEAFAPAVEGALAAARAQGFALHALVGDAEREAERLAREGARFDVVVVDPPRRGLTPRLRRAIAALAPRAVAYVSCDPSTLARDLADLAWRGLAARTIEPWDFVPLTAHVEALAWLEPSPPPPLVVVGRVRGGVIVDAPPHLDVADLVARVTGGTSSQPARGARGPAPIAPLPRGGSGALLVAAGGGPAPALGGARVVVAVRGATHASLRGIDGVVEVLARAASRSLLAVELGDARDLARLPDALARAGHPVLGDPRDAATARHVLEKHGVDRPLIHVEALEVQGGARCVAPLAPDLRAALGSLGLATPPAA